MLTTGTPGRPTAASTMNPGSLPAGSRWLRRSERTSQQARAYGELEPDTHLRRSHTPAQSRGWRCGPAAFLARLRPLCRSGAKRTGQRLRTDGCGAGLGLRSSLPTQQLQLPVGDSRPGQAVGPDGHAGPSCRPCSGTCQCLCNKGPPQALWQSTIALTALLLRPQSSHGPRLARCPWGSTAACKSRSPPGPSAADSTASSSCVVFQAGWQPLGSHLRFLASHGKTGACRASNPKHLWDVLMCRMPAGAQLLLPSYGAPAALAQHGLLVSCFRPPHCVEAAY